MQTCANGYDVKSPAARVHLYLHLRMNNMSKTWWPVLPQKAPSHSKAWLADWREQHFLQPFGPRLLCVDRDEHSIYRPSEQKFKFDLTCR